MPDYGTCFPMTSQRYTHFPHTSFFGKVAIFSYPTNPINPFIPPTIITYHVCH